jgi:hypothetical protein
MIPLDIINTNLCFSVYNQLPFVWSSIQNANGTNSILRIPAQQPFCVTLEGELLAKPELC